MISSTSERSNRSCEDPVCIFKNVRDDQCILRMSHFITGNLCECHFTCGEVLQIIAKHNRQEEDNHEV